MSSQCPLCNSYKIASLRNAMKIGAAIGTVGGAAQGASSALAGGRFGAAVGAIAGPPGLTLGAISGAVLGGLAGGVGGCALGAQQINQFHEIPQIPTVSLLTSNNSRCVNQPLNNAHLARITSNPTSKAASVPISGF